MTAFDKAWRVAKSDDDWHLPRFVSWLASNDKSDEAFASARGGFEIDECHICQGQLEMNALICMSCEDHYSWADGPLSEGFYLRTENCGSENCEHCGDPLEQEV